jgi:hypothetical protein
VEIYHAPPRVLAALTQQRTVRDQAAPKRVAIMTWETTDLPGELGSMLGWFDAVITPSEFCAGVIGKDLNPRTSLHVVPHCFDELFWPAPDPDWDGDRPYRFYSIGAWGERKNHLGVLRAYLHEFTKSDRVQLMLLIEGADFDEIRSVIARSGIPPAELPELNVPDVQDVGHLDEAQLVELHIDGDCFVSATRGEGWGLGMFEAAILGKAVIAPRWGGQLDFLEHYRWYRPVHQQLTPCWGSETRERVVEQGGQHVQVSKISLPPGVNCKQLWGEPDLHTLAKQMRRAFIEAPQGRSLDCVTERAALEARFGYKTVGPLMANLLRGISWQSNTHSTP